MSKLDDSIDLTSEANFAGRYDDNLLRNDLGHYQQVLADKKLYSGFYQISKIADIVLPVIGNEEEFQEQEHLSEMVSKVYGVDSEKYHNFRKTIDPYSYQFGDTCACCGAVLYEYVNVGKYGDLCKECDETFETNSA